MLGIKHSLAILAVTAGVLGATQPSNLVLYNGHAGLGAQVTDGTSNTIMFAAKNEVSIETLE